MQPGDVLIELDGKLVTSFGPLGEILDANVKKTLSATFERGSKSFTAQLPVSSLHDITPDRYLEFGGGVFHDLSYQLARNFKIACGGAVYVASAGYMLKLAKVPEDVCIVGCDDKPVRSLQDFIGIIQKLPDRIRVPMRYFRLNDVNKEVVAVIQIERTWHDFRLAVRNGTFDLFLE